MCNLRILKKSGSAFPLDFTGVSRYNFSVTQEVFPYMEQSMDLPQGYQIRPLTTDDLDQYNALLRYAFQVTEQELFDTGWKDEEIKQSKCPVLKRADVLGCFDRETLISQIAVYPLKANIYDSVYPIGFVTSVCTYPEYTGRGIMKRLMYQALVHMRERKQPFGMLFPYSIPLYRRFGANAMAALERNPYLLSDSAFGVDFSVCDEIALSMGFGGDASLRTEAGLTFELSHNRDAGGHVFLPREKLLAATAQLLDCDVDAVEKSLDDLIALHRIVQEGVANVTACYLRQSWEDETYVVTRIEAMLADKPDALRGVERVIKEIEREQGVQYAPLQRQAVELAAKEELLLLTGGPGTGKTTSVRAIVALFERMGLNVLLAAPTGRAAKRMGELCDRDAQTIHRMLGMTFNDQTGEVTFTKGEKEPLEADALIVDETSMVDLSLMRALLAALRPGCRLVLVGDPDQLPSVGAGNVFSDLIRSGRIATVALRDIFRQAEQSMIVRNAHLVNTGMPPKLKNAAANDFFFLPRRDSVRLVETVVELCKTRLPDKMGIPADELQVLTPTRRGDAGTRSLNFALQAALNPPKPGKQERRFGELIFREGDRVMQTRNDYDVVWQKEDGTAGTGIFNGDVGKIAKIDPSGELLEIVFDDRTATYTSDMLAELDMAYAMTVHKAQGSEYRGVVFIGAPCAPSLMVRGVLYTAITRARELLVIVGDDSAVNKMAENDRRSRRYSGLKWRLRKGGEEK